MKTILLALFTAVSLAVAGDATEPLFKPGDVVAFVGGEDMVDLSEYGYLEQALTRALPGQQLRFRNLAWEGDTVFEQRRDLNFPPIETQLDKIGATVVVAQFGQMESFGGPAKLPEFVAAYEKLIEKLRGSAAEKRRLLLVSPIAKERLTKLSAEDLAAYTKATAGLAEKLGLPFVDCHDVLIAEDQERQAAGKPPGHLGYESFSNSIMKSLGLGADLPPLADDSLRAKIGEKNRLWFNYWRPQNWAFLNGDRTAQPSSRDHLDPSKRWFPDEIEQYLPLIETKEREIATLAKP